MSKLSTIWKNKKQILEGITNSIIRDKFVEDIAKTRLDTCNTCEFKGNKCMVSGTEPCCNICGCSLSLSTRALSYQCPKNKWISVLTQEEEDSLHAL